MATRLDDSWRGAIVVDYGATFENAISKLISMLEEYYPKAAQRIHTMLEGKDLACIEDSLQDELIDYAFGAMNRIAPKGSYFGVHPFDGSTLGFWSIKWDWD